MILQTDRTIVRPWRDDDRDDFAAMHAGMARAAWGSGYVTEASRAVLDDGFLRCGFKEVLSYTEDTNLRSQAVMNRLGLAREPARDFIVDVDATGRSFVVFVAYPQIR